MIRNTAVEDLKSMWVLIEYKKCLHNTNFFRDFAHPWIDLKNSKANHFLAWMIWIKFFF